MAEERGVVKYEAKDGTEVRLTFDTIRKYLVSGKPEYVTDQELMFFMGTCKARGLNPFARDCYLIKYTQNDPAAIITSIDYFRARAKSQPDCQGWKSGVIVRGKDGSRRESSGIVEEGEDLLGGWFEATPKGWAEPFRLEVNLKPYIKMTAQGVPTKFWSKDNQPTMIRKVAESQGLREVWPSEFAKIYVPEEVDSGMVMDAAFSAVSSEEASQQPTAVNYVAAFDVATKDLDKDLLAKYLDVCSTHYGKGLDGFKTQVMKAKELPSFKEAFASWCKGQRKSAAPTPEPSPAAVEPDIVPPEPETDSMNQDQFLTIVNELVQTMPGGKAECLRLLKDMRISKVETVPSSDYQAFIQELTTRLKEK